MRNKLLAVLAAVLLTVGGGIAAEKAEAQAFTVWWVVYQNTSCSGEGLAVYNYATLVFLWSHGLAQSLRAFEDGKLRHCEYDLPYETENTR